MDEGRSESVARVSGTILASGNVFIRNPTSHGLFSRVSRLSCP